MRAGDRLENPVRDGIKTSGEGRHKCLGDQLKRFVSALYEGASGESIEPVVRRATRGYWFLFSAGVRRMPVSNSFRRRDSAG